MKPGYAVLFTVCCLFGGGEPCRAAPTLIPRSGLRITRSARLRPGVYHLSDPGSGMIEVTGSRITLDLRGVHILGASRSAGVGIHVHDARSVTIKGAGVAGCLWGVVVERCVGVRILGCQASWNADLTPGTVIDESGQQPEDQHGGGFLLRDCQSCALDGCSGEHEWDGVDVVRSKGNSIAGGDFSYNGNWGIHLWDSSRNEFVNNRAVWCTTGGGLLYQATTGWQTYDAQAVGIDHNSCRNLIQGNDLRFGGDGIFIRANEGGLAPGTKVPPRNSSDGNILRDNDCSFSPNNAIEVDFVANTIIQNNNCSSSNYGMWLGYARHCRVELNTCVNDFTRAVEIENGQGDLFTGNLFGWDTARPDGSLVYLRQNGRDSTPSGPYTLTDNVFYGAGTGVLLKQTPASLDHNVVLGSAAHLVRLEGAGPQPRQGTVLFAQLDPDLLLGRSSAPAVIRPGRITISGAGLEDAGTVLVEVNGIPAWVRSTQPLTFDMPPDMWIRPAAPSVQIRLFAQHRWRRVPGQIPVEWSGPRITSVEPSPAVPGHMVTVTGAGLAGGEALVNGVAVPAVEHTSSVIRFVLPASETGPVNIVWVSGRHLGASSSWPVALPTKAR